MLKPNRLFSDDVNFSYGFSRSGVFTIEQSDILEEYGLRMRQLAAEEVENPDEDELLFLKELKYDDDSQVTSIYAKCWRKYLKEISRHHVNAALFDVPSKKTESSVVPNEVNQEDIESESTDQTEDDLDYQYQEDTTQLI